MKSITIQRRYPSWIDYLMVSGNARVELTSVRTYHVHKGKKSIIHEIAVEPCDIRELRKALQVRETELVRQGKLEEEVTP